MWKNNQIQKQNEIVTRNTKKTTNIEIEKKLRSLIIENKNGI